MYKYKHHNAAFSIATSDIENDKLRLKVGHAIDNVFKGFLKSDSNNVQFEFFFTDKIEKFIKDTEFVNVKNIKVGNTQTHFKDYELDFLIDNSNPFKVIVNIIDNETIQSSLRVFNKGFANNIEQQVSTFYYRVFLLFSQLWNTQNGLTYLHSSAVSVKGKSIIFTADSGVGKSALLFKLSQDKNFKFIADDLTLISNKSESFFQGRCLSVKPYHLKYFSFLSEKLKVLMGSVQKLQWKIINDNRLTYRIAPTELFDQICEKSEIKRIIHLCNYSKDTYEIKNISAVDLLGFTLSILTNELFLLNHKLNTLASLPNSPFINSSVLYKTVSDIYSQAFKNIEIKLVFVPYMSDPNDLYEFLKSEGCLS